MKTIKFSHRYLKMPCEDEDRKTILLQVCIRKIEDLSKEFLDYDTQYLDKKGKICYHKLPKKGDVLVLFLFSEGVIVNWNPVIWTTIRKYTSEKFEYYGKAIGEEFKIVIEEE